MLSHAPSSVRSDAAPKRAPRAKPAARQQLRSPAAHELGRVNAGRTVQRCGHRLGAECAECRRKRIAMSPAAPAAPPRQPRVGDVPEIASSSGARLPAPLLKRAEAQFGTDLGAVEVHDGPQARQASRKLAARAFAVEHRIFFGEGQYRPETEQGIELLGHELAHVVQQRQGLVESEVKGEGDRYEREAEAAGVAFRRGQPVRIGGGGGARPAPQAAPLQRSLDPGADAAQVGVDDSPLDLPFLGEANSERELNDLLAEIGKEEGAARMAAFGERHVVGGLAGQTSGGGSPPTASSAVPQAAPLQTAPLGAAAERTPLVQRAVVAGCDVPGVAPNLIGMAAHAQIQGTCALTAPGCRSEVILGPGRADLVRERIPAAPEIGEIKPASWLGRGLQYVAEGQLAAYLATYYAMHGPPPPLPMWSFAFPPEPFVANPSQTLLTAGPLSGVYYYYCRRPTRRRRVRVPVQVPAPAPVPAEEGSSTARRVGTGFVATVGVFGVGYLVYRGLRMIPSIVIPPLWPTIPANAVIP